MSFLVHYLIRKKWTVIYITDLTILYIFLIFTLTRRPYVYVRMYVCMYVSKVTNIGAHRVDLTWSPPSITEFDQMTITGYKILWFRPQFRSRVSNLTVGNVTTTSIRGLEPATEYVFAIAAMSEGADK